MGVPMNKEATMAKKKTSRFVVSFEVEVEHAGDASDACETIEEAVAKLVDDAADWQHGGIKAPGVKITDAVNFTSVVVSMARPMRA